MREHLASFKPLFVETARMYTQGLLDNIAALRKNPHDTYAVTSSFIAAHSLTGQSAVMGFSQMEALSRAVEKIFHQLQEKTYSADEHVLGSLQEALRSLQEDIVRIEKDNEENDLSSIVRTIADIANVS